MGGVGCGVVWLGGVGGWVSGYGLHHPVCSEVGDILLLVQRFLEPRATSQLLRVRGPG